MFVIWKKIFNNPQEELDDEPVEMEAGAGAQCPEDEKPRASHQHHGPTRGKPAPLRTRGSTIPGVWEYGSTGELCPNSRKTDRHLAQSEASKRAILRSVLAKNAPRTTSNETECVFKKERHPLAGDRRHGGGRACGRSSPENYQGPCGGITERRCGGKEAERNACSHACGS